ncbi:MAG: hypothetical protein Fur0040_07620 [Sideroxydans sp.]
MNTLRILTSAALLLLALLSLSACSAVPGKPASVSKGSLTLSQAYTWYDGQTARTVWLNPQLLAEFGGGTPATAAAVKAADAGASLVEETRPQVRGLRLWRLQSPALPTVRSLTTNAPAGRYSPVFHDSASSQGSMRALPGNIIVTLNPAWDDAQAQQWIAAHQLEVVKKLPFGRHIYVFKTAPGLAALETANALYRSGEVVSATPDWWQEVATR